KYIPRRIMNAANRIGASGTRGEAQWRRRTSARIVDRALRNDVGVQVNSPLSAASEMTEVPNAAGDRGVTIRIIGGRCSPDPCIPVSPHCPDRPIKWQRINRRGVLSAVAVINALCPAGVRTRRNSEPARLPRAEIALIPVLARGPHRAAAICDRLTVLPAFCR